MSTLKTTNLQHASAGSPAIVLASDGTATAQLSSLNGGPLAGARNRIINGDMRIDQRNAGASVSMTAGGVFGTDRWQGFEDSDGTMTMQQSTVAPAGHTNSLLLTTGTADSSLTGSQGAVILQSIEGFNTADLAWGTASAQAITLSFWVRSSLTGTFGGSLRNSGSSRSYVFSYSISAANTWEYKSITISGDTSGTWLADNGQGINVTFSLGAGPTISGTAGSWSSSNLASANGATSVIGTNGATFYITGAQLEPGSVATPFERRSYGQELALCQRYTRKITNATVSTFSTTTAVYSNNSWPMRALPTSTLITNGQLTGNNSNNNVTGISGPTGDGDGFYFDVSSTGLTATASYNLRGTLIILSAEL